MPRRELPATARRPQPDAERIAAIRLIRSENVGPVTFRDLLSHYGSARTALEALPELSRRGGRRQPIRVWTQSEAEAEISRAQRFGAELILVSDPAYPTPLGTLDAPPPLLYAKGDISLLQKPTIAIVGSRQCSAAGAKLARLFAAEIGRAGYVIASGLARGIDAAAHQAAISTGTIAVLAGGIDHVYPPEHDTLQQAIGERGCLLSEMPFGFTPRGQDFPRRNRIVSGLSLGVLIIEAARRSGTLVTARLAAEQGREVFAVPGHPLDPRAEGTNKLLKSGATFVTEPADILSALSPQLNAPPRQLREEPLANHHVATPPSDDDRGRILSALGPAPVDIDSLARATGLPIRSVQIAVMELALAGRLERHGGLISSSTPADGLYPGA